MGIGSTIGNAVSYASNGLQATGLASAAESMQDSIANSSIADSMDGAMNNFKEDVAQQFEQTVKNAGSLLKASTQSS